MLLATLSTLLILSMRAGYVYAIPPSEWDHTVHGGKDDTGKCSTTADANLNDCEVLLNSDVVFKEKRSSWGQWTLNERESVVANSGAYRVACNGRCCVYFRWKGDTGWVPFSISGDQIDAVRLDALSLMGCGDREKGLINGVGRFMRGTDDEHNVCIGNLDAAHDCFGDVGDSS